MISEEVGQHLTENGVKLFIYYGSQNGDGLYVQIYVGWCSCVNSAEAVTEEAKGDDWAYFELSPHSEVRVLERSEGAVELAFMKCETHIPSLLNATVDDRPAFMSSDLVIPHPTRPGLFKIFGRADDQIVLSTGEKTNPTPIEKILQKHPSVAHAVMFGQSKFFNGCLIDPERGYEVADGNDSALVEFRRRLAPVLTEANAFAPAHSRLYPEMIILTSPKKPLALTGKGTPRRAFVLKEYAAEIEQLYKLVESGMAVAAVGEVPLEFDEASIARWVRSVVFAILGHSIEDDDDIFSVGGDSLTAAWMRNNFLKTLREHTNIPVRTLPMDFVFMHHTVKQLTSYFYQLHVERQRSTANGLDDKQNADLPPDFPTIGRVGETILKLRRGADPPLIVIHGAGGTVHAFPVLQEKFTTSLWCIQWTPDAPLTSLAEMADFYFLRVKEQQPNGPYRLAGFSGTSILAMLLAKRLEDNGDVVVQLGLIDHFPSVFLHPVYGLAAAVRQRDAAHRQFFTEQSLAAVCAVLRLDGDGKMKRRHRVADELLAASKGLPASQFAITYWKTLEKYQGAVIDHLESMSSNRNINSIQATLTAWVRSIRAPMQLCVASRGVNASLPEVDRVEWRDFLAQEWHPGIEVHHVDAGHFDILGNEKVIDWLQNEWRS